MILNILFLLLISIIAGVINGIVGMAVLVLYPALIYVGVSPIEANMTITVGLLFGGTSVVLSSRKELHGMKKQTTIITAIALIGGIIGSFILLHSSTKSFQEIVPIVIFLSGILMLLPQNHNIQKITDTLWAKTIAIIALILVGIYTGYFGAGSVLLLIAILSRIIDKPYANYNAVRNVVSLTINTVSALIFVFNGHIDWKALIIIAIGLVIGGHFGPIIVRYIPTKVMKYSIGIFAIILAIYLGFTTYF